MRAGLFPGQGLDPSTVAAALPDGHDLLARADDLLGYDVKRRVVQIANRSRPVLPTDLGQPAIFLAGIISFEEARHRGEHFDFLAGHSLGEYTALVAAGSIRFSQGLRLVAARGLYMHRAGARGAGGMAAVLNVSFEETESVCAETGVVLANDNSPNQVVLSGPAENLSRAAPRVRDLGGRIVRLPIDGAYHSEAMEPAVAELATALAGTEVRSPEIPVVSNVSAAPYRAPGEIRKLLARQLTARVRFRESISWLVDHGVTEFVDMGPENVVGRLANATVASHKGIDIHA